MQCEDCVKIKYLMNFKGGVKVMRERLSVITPEITELSDLCVRCGRIDPGLYGRYDVKRGLRDINGKGVVAG